MTGLRLRFLLDAPAVLLAGLCIASCTAGPTPPASFLPGTVAAPREINLIASDYAFVPAVIRVVPGETVVIHVVNGGLAPHEAVIGNTAVQLAWEAAEAATAGHPPGPTPVVGVPPGLAGVRVFAASGQRADVVWTVPADVTLTAGTGASPGSLGTAAPAEQRSPAPEAWLIGCHLPGHFAKGMLVPIEFVAPGGVGLGG